MSGKSGRRVKDFEGMIGSGENPKGFTSQTVNGTGHWQGTGWNGPYPWDEYTAPEIEPHGAWQPGRSNRTAE